jgi:hypothetical protein
MVLVLLVFLTFGTAISHAEETSRVYEKSAVLTQESNIELVGSLIQGKRENPFLTMEEELSLSESRFLTPIDYLNLSAVLYSPGESKVIINGYILKERDYIDNKEIIEIHHNAVILKDSQGKYLVGLREVGS